MRKSALVVMVACTIAGAFVVANARAADMHVPLSPFCLKESDATAQVQLFLKRHNGSTMDVMAGEDAAAWVDAFNTTIPPTSDYKADLIWVIANPKEDSDSLRIVLFVDGETCLNLPMPMRMFAYVEAQAKGNSQ